MSETKLLKTSFYVTLLFIGILLAIAIVRTFLISNEKVSYPCSATEVDFVSGDELFARMSTALTFETISFEPKKHNSAELLKLLAFIEKSFPRVHSVPFIKKEIVNNFSLLYTVTGLNPKLKPYMLAGHLDVVPVDTEKWEIPPFSGKIENGYINGRGSIDAKHIVMGLLEALEFLLKKGFRPQRTIILAFGHDEEVYGENGANHISQILISRGINLEYLLDEGTFIMNGLILGIKVPVAFISVAEKGSANIKLAVETTPGHSSSPPPETAIVILAKAVAKLPGNVFPSMLGSDLDYKFFEALAPYATLPFRFVYANFWLFKSAISWVMSLNYMQSSLIKTTAAVTIISGGLKNNVLPSNASAVINLRIHPLQSINEVLNYVKDVINDDRVHVEIIHAFEPHPISPFSNEDFGYMTIKNSIREIHPEVPVVPTTLMANTDTRWYLNLTKAVYRFSPVELKPHEIPRFHGHNEKIAMDNYRRIVNFYVHLIKNSDKMKLKATHSHQEF